MEIDDRPEAPPHDTFIDVGPVVRDEADMVRNAEGQVISIGPVDMAMRTRKLARGQHPSYTREFILQNLQRMLLMRMPHDEIAHRFGVHVYRIGEWKRELNRRQAEEAKRLNPAGSIGRSLAHFDSTIAFAWQQANQTGMSAKDKRGWVETALKAEVEKQKLLQLCGLYANQFLSQQTDDEDAAASGASALANMAKMFLEGEFARDERMTVDEASAAGAQAPDDLSFIL